MFVLVLGLGLGCSPNLGLILILSLTQGCIPKASLLGALTCECPKSLCGVVWGVWWGGGLNQILFSFGLVLCVCALCLCQGKPFNSNFNGLSQPDKIT